MNTNKTVIDITKCVAADFTYETPCGNYRRHSLPTLPTVHGCEFSPTDLITVGRSTCTLLEVAKARQLLDRWVPTLHLTHNGQTFIYTGKKATSLWQAWNAHIFRSGSKKKGKK